MNTPDLIMGIAVTTIGVCGFITYAYKLWASLKEPTSLWDMIQKEDKSK